MSSVIQYSVVRIKALKDPSINHNGWGSNKRPPKVGDTGTVIDILKAAGHPDHYVVESVDQSDSSTVWLSEFTIEELETV